MNSIQIISNVKKEIWEFKKALVWTPIIMAILLLAQIAFEVLTLDGDQVARLSQLLDRAQQPQNLTILNNCAFIFVNSIFGIFLFIATLFQLRYFISCLFDERRDLSVYFWRSLPVSDFQAISVKLFVGAIIIPVIFVLAGTFIVIIAIALFALAIVILPLGGDGSLWQIWSSIDVFSLIASIWLSIFSAALWLFPLYAWLMLASMYAKRTPFLWAVLPIVFLLLFEFILVKVLGYGHFFFINILRNYFYFTSFTSVDSHININGYAFLRSTDLSSYYLFNAVFMKKVTIVGTLIGCGFMYLTYWLRVNRGDA